MENSNHGGLSSSDSTSADSPNPKPSTFSASMLTPSEVEWLKRDSEQARDFFQRLAQNDEGLSALIGSEPGS